VIYQSERIWLLLALSIGLGKRARDGVRWLLGIERQALLHLGVYAEPTSFFRRLWLPGLRQRVIPVQSVTSLLLY
jgi:hypothetical protein